jgi:hypothetical protein
VLAVVEISRVETRRRQPVIDPRRLADLRQLDVVIEIRAELLLNPAGKIARTDSGDPIGETQRFVALDRCTVES